MRHETAAIVVSCTYSTGMLWQAAAMHQMHQGNPLQVNTDMFPDMFPDLGGQQTSVGDCQCHQ